MAVVLPIISAFSAISAAGGVGAALTAGVGSFMSVAGGVLAGVGALTGSKDLKRIGSLVSLGGAAAGAFGTMAAAGGGSSGGSSSLVDPGGAGGSEASQFTKFATEAGGDVTDLTSAVQGSQLGALGTGLGVQTNAVAAPFDAASQLTGGGAGASSVSAAPGGLWASAAERVGSLGDTAASIGSQLTQSLGTPSLSTGGAVGQAASTVSPLAKAASGLDASSLQSLLGTAYDKAASLAGGAVNFAKNNPELLKIGAGALQGMYGPEAEALDYRKSLLARRLRNLNSPIALSYNPAPAP